MKKDFIPAYLHYTLSELNAKAEALLDRMTACDICPFECGANRFTAERGKCGEGAGLRVSSYNIHRGEEPPVSGYGGSGTIFLTGCHFSCLFCQNYPISQLGNGREYTPERLADKMMWLQGRGVHNINLVTPTHFSPQLMQAVIVAREKGLRIPVAYNNSGYEKRDVLSAVTMFADIFLFDVKYGDNALSEKLSGASDYREVNTEAFESLHELFGDEYDMNKVVFEGTEYEIMRRGLIIRHLVIPGEMGNSKLVLESIAKVTVNTWVALMNQYFPAWKIWNMPQYAKKLGEDEYDEVKEKAFSLGMYRLFLQDF